MSIRIHYLILFLSISIAVIGQLCLKYGAVRIDGIKSFVLQPYIAGGLFLYLLSSVLYIYSLRQIPVSIALPCVSVSYVIIALLAHVIWGEPLGIQQIFALCFIVTGVVLLVKA